MPPTVDVEDHPPVAGQGRLAVINSAGRFYLKYGFAALADDERHLYLPLATVRKVGLA